MSYFEFPHTRSYDGDLGYIIERLDELTQKYGEFMEYNQIKFADPVEWSINRQYEAWTLIFDVIWQEVAPGEEIALRGYNLYMSIKPVPKGINIHNEDYWQLVLPVTIDTELNIESNNVVTNHAITSELQRLATRIDNAFADISTQTDRIDTLRTDVDGHTADIERLNEVDVGIYESIAETNNRISTIAAAISPGTTSADAELIDIRTWFNGDTSVNAGDAVRGQINYVIDLIDKSVHVTTTDTDHLNWNDGYILPNGRVTTAPGTRQFTDALSCTEGDIITFKGETNNTNVSSIAFYYSTNTNDVVSAINNLGDITNSYTVKIPVGAKFFRISAQNSQITADIPFVTYYKLSSNHTIDNTIYYVSTTGSDSNDGLTPDTAFATFTNAIKHGKNIKAKRGEYSESIRVFDIDNISITPYDNDEVYDHSAPVREKIKIIADNNTTNVAYFNNCNNLYLEDIHFNTASQSVLLIENSNGVTLNNCEASESAGNMGFAMVNCDAIFNNCYAHDNHIDGFNFHGYGTTIMNDCISENNSDDGCSHHDACIGTINGGRFEGNAKAGIAPAYGATVNIYDIVAKNNLHGIGYLSTNNGHAAMKGIINSCVMIDNTEGLKVDPLCTVTAVNCKYSGNTTDKVVTGTLNEY